MVPLGDRAGHYSVQHVELADQISEDDGAIAGHGGTAFALVLADRALFVVVVSERAARPGIDQMHT